MLSKTVRLVAPLTPDECAERLFAALKTPVKHAIRGSVFRNSFEFRRGKWYNNSFQPHLKGTVAMRDDGKSSLVIATLGMPGGVLAFVVVWLLAATIFSAVALFLSFQKWCSEGSVEWNLVRPAIIMPLGGVFLVLFGHHIARQEEPELLEVLREALGAEVETV